MGAVNCAVLRNGKYIGENTDGKGFLQSLQAVADPAGKRVMIFGAGGAARAVAVELALAGAAAIDVVNRSAARGQELVDVLNSKTKAVATLTVWNETQGVPADIDILVNCTSIGLSPDVDARPDIDFATLRPDLVVADVVASPPDTHLIRQARTRGATAIDGLGMLVNQGVISIKYWTGIDVDPAVMRAKIEVIFGL
jgi:shikimate dehydrogenase